MSRSSLQAHRKNTSIYLPTLYACTAAVFRAPRTPPCPALTAAHAAHSNRLVGGNYRCEHVFNEQMRTHFHLCGYSLVRSTFVLLAAGEKLDALSAEEWEELTTAGHQYGEVLMAVIERAHKAGGLLWSVPPRQYIKLPSPVASVSLHLLSQADEREMLAAVQRKEAAWQEARLPQVRQWEAELDSALAADTIEVQKLRALVKAGAEAFDVRFEYVSHRSSASNAQTGLRAYERLTQLHAQLSVATTWSEKNTELSKGAQSIEALSELVEEAKTFPLRLQEVGEVAAKLEKMTAWIEQARQLMAATCELRELQELQREAEQLRIKAPEAEAVRLRSQSGKRWVNQVHNELLRRVSSRTAGGGKLTAADVEALLVQVHLVGRVAVVCRAAAV